MLIRDRCLFLKVVGWRFRSSRDPHQHPGVIPPQLSVFDQGKGASVLSSRRCEMVRIHDCFPFTHPLLEH